ncbi:MAG: SprT-like domain-containing protein, partial [Gemmatimonadales bacterium]|nr:SprT-like domain-containing protein [Gemmatimonadales bacterium]
PARGLITLRPDLDSAFDAALCHEAAHVAAFVLHGRTVRPHGAEWASLVAAVGFDPVVRARVPGARRQPGRPIGYRFEHRCPVCQSVRLARRRITTWRCAECVEAGLEGVMDIRPYPTNRAPR